MLPLTYSTAVICAVFILTEAVSGQVVKKAVGDTVSFRPSKLESFVTSITWKHRTSVSTVKAIEWDIDEAGYAVPNQLFKDITTLDNKNGEITITGLKVEHSGNYTIDINSKEQEQRFTLEVMERVTKPVITVEESGNTEVVYLRCENSETIIWKNSSGDTLEGQKNHEPGEFITVKNTGNPENFYTCKLQNAVSEETSEPVYERDIFKTESGPWWIALIVLFILILVAAFVLYKFYPSLRGYLDGKTRPGTVGEQKPLKDKTPSDAENGGGAGVNAEPEPLQSSSDKNGEPDYVLDLEKLKAGTNYEYDKIDVMKSPSDAANADNDYVNAELEPMRVDNDVGDKVD